jgi:TIR domain
MSNTVFLSYAREDSDSAQRLVADLRAHGISVWFDRDSLTPGQVWKEEIKRVIRESDFFLALLSSNSVDKRGFVQAELATAKSVLDEIPHGRIYLIPARLDDCNVDPRLRAYHCSDLFADWNAGVSQILKAIGLPRGGRVRQGGGRADAQPRSGTRPCHSEESRTVGVGSPLYSPSRLRIGRILSSFGARWVA